jgi:hypothetical protein
VATLAAAVAGAAVYTEAPAGAYAKV